MESREEEIRGLKASITVREGVRERFLEDPQSYVELTKEIIIDKQRLLIMEQQRKFDSHISIILFQSYR